MAAGFPSPALVSIPQDGIIPVSGSLLNSTYDVIPPGLREGTLHSWNVAFQRQLPFDLTADITYVGNRGVNLVMDVDENASLVYGSGNVGRPQFAAYTRTGTSRVRSNDNKSEYHALQVKVDRRFHQWPASSPTPTRSAESNGLREREHQHRHADRFRT